MSNKFTQQQLYDFLVKIDKDYPVPLSQKVKLLDYSKKLYDKAHINVVIEDGKIISLVAGYTKNLIDNIAFIALVGTVADARGKGHAEKLIHEFIAHCCDSRIGGIHLYTTKENSAAISMYSKIGFVDYITKTNRDRMTFI